MKHALLVLSAALSLTGCATVKVAHTDVASGAHSPRAIYIRSYIADESRFKGNHGHVGEKPIRRSLAPAEYSKALKEELEKMAPAMVLKDDEEPETGWLVESDLVWVHGGSPALRATPFGHLGAGRSFVRIHVRVTDLDRSSGVSDAKKESTGTATEVAGRNGPVIYEFDLKGGSRLTGPAGSIYAPGLGHATPFDFKNAAERVLMALSLDPHRYGVRSEPVIR
jgi:predicted small secreted protein